MCNFCALCRWPHVKSTTKRPSEYVKEWMNAGATWLGGCCCIRPKDILDIRAAICQRLNELQMIDGTAPAE